MRKNYPLHSTNARRYAGFSLFVFLLLVMSNRAAAQLTYCTAANTDPNAAGSLMSNVTFGSINNTTGSTYPVNGYSYWPALTTTVIMGTTENLTISIDPPSSYSGAIVSVWIDWNQDGTLAASEWLQVGTNLLNANNPHTIAIPVPLTAVPGTTRMRIRSRGTGNPNGSGDACSSMGSGETEDYDITVVPATACSGTPNAGDAVVNPATICFGQSVTLGLTGNTVASGLSYQWETATSLSGPWTPVGSSLIAPNYTTTPTASGVVYYRCQVSCGSATAASVVDSVVIPTPFPAGTYTIDPAGSGPNNFTSISAAVSAINCGITGHVIFNLAPNTTFNEQVTIPSTIGTNASQTVIFNGNGDTLVWAGTAAAPWTLGLNGADYVTFNDFVFRGTNSTSALVVHLWGQADTNTFNNCWFITNPNVTSTAAVPFSISGSATSVATTGTSGNGNTLNGCKLINGYDGAYFYGNTAGANQGNKVLNCLIRDFYRYGIYSYYQTGMNIVGDTIERPTRTSLTTFYGIYLSTQTTGALLERNLIRNTHGGNNNNTGTAYGVYCGSAGTAANPNRFINNVIAQFNGRTSGSYYGLYLSGNYQRAFHNTIAFTDTTTVTGTIYGLYASGTAGMAIRNNNISIQQPGTGMKIALYYSGTGKNSNNNNLHISSPGGTNYIGYYSSTAVYLNSMAAWRALGFDSASVSEDPVFVSPATSNYMPSSGQMDDKGDAGANIATDILGNLRNFTPDIGAYEFTAPPCGGTPLAGTASAPSDVCANAPFTLSVTGFSTSAGITVQWEESPLGAGLFLPIAGATSTAYTVSTGVTSPMEYRAVVTCINGGGFDVTSPASVNISPFYLCYCSPTNTGTTLNTYGYNYIINASITGTTLNYNSPQGIGVTIAGGYNQFWPINGSNSNTASLVQGIQYTVNAEAAYSGYPISAWLDYDGSGTFDSSEFVPLTVASNGTSYSGTFMIPYSSATGYIGLRFRLSDWQPFTHTEACYSAYGYETEDYVVDVTAAPGCSGTPSGGNAYAPDSVCPSVVFVLSDTAYSFGQGISYEWEQSPAGLGTWTPISGATNPTYSVAAGIIAPTDFRMKVTCSNGGGFGYSNILSILVKNPLQCYCMPTYTYNCSSGDDIDDFILVGDIPPGINNLNTPCPSNGYIDYTYMSATLSAGLTYSGNVTTNYGSTSEYVRIWIDYNLDGVFQSSEEVATVNAISNASTGAFSFTIPPTTSAGSYRMRVRLVWNQSPASSIDPCINYGYGETHDYMVTIAPPPTCSPVTNVVPGTVLFNSANVSWNQSVSTPGIGYQWVVVPQGSSPSATPVSSGMETPGDTTATATGLSASTNYSIFIRSICTVGDTSVWTSVNFTTPCSTFVSPVLESFNGTTTPNCWTNSGAVPYGWMFGTGYSTPGYDAAGLTDHTGTPGSTFAWVDGSYVSNNQTAVLTSPVIDISTLTNPRLRYYLMSYNPTYAATYGHNRLIVAAWDGTSWITVDSVQQSLNQGWNVRTASLSALGSVTTTQLRFTYTGTASTTYYNDIAIDDVMVESTPTCPDPSNIVVTTPTANSVTLNWTENGSATQWQVRYVPFGSTSFGTVTGVINTKPYTLTGISGAYNIYVRSICGPNDTSTWSMAQLAATLPPNDACTGAINLVGGTIYNGYNNGATQSLAACDATAVANDVWYSFTTGSIGGSVTVTVVSTIADFVMQGYSGSCTGTLTAMIPTSSSSPTLQTCIDGPAAGTEYGVFTVSANTTYYIRVYGYNTDQGTFTIQATGTPLAIKLANITATNVGSHNRINWATEDEAKGDMFELERSVDGRNFTTIATLAAKGQPSNYTYIDEDPITGVNYYRLKLKDVAGNTEYSQTVQATVKGGKFLVQVYPNPVSDVLTIEVYGTDAATGTVTISDVTGKVVKVLNMEDGVATVDMKGMAQGMYLVRYADDNHTQVIKVNKQ